MPDPQIEKLLIVQDRDITLQKIEQELSRLPKERAALDAKIQEEEANVEAARQSLKEKEVLRNELDSEVKAKENEVQRFQTQQLEVKKNEEYRALTHQIEQAKADISSLEEREIELMLEIDTVTEAFEADKAEIEARIKEQRRHIDLLGEKETNLKASIEAAKSDLLASREGIEDSFIEHYDRVRKLVKRAPYVTRIEAHTCKRCHLRVSNEVSREALNHGEVHFCDQCSCIVYA
ncbi:MAG: zinc ribbon domain-containing protein [Coraliomargarita sp.]